MTALDEILELLHRFDVAVDQGLLAEIRRRRQARSQPWEREDQASRDLRRIGALARAIHTHADELLSIAERYTEPKRQAG